jgi:hypothetical protein
MQYYVLKIIVLCVERLFEAIGRCAIGYRL